jgi:hypothetical protein
VGSISYLCTLAVVILTHFTQIVERSSSLLNLPNEILIPTNANHREMVQFSSATDANFQTVISILGQFRDQLEQAYRQRHPSTGFPIPHHPLPPPPAYQPASRHSTTIGSIGPEPIPPALTKTTSGISQSVHAHVGSRCSLLIDVIGFRNATEIVTSVAQEVQDSPESLQPTISTFLNEGFHNLLTRISFSNLYNTSVHTASQDPQPPSASFKLF